MKITRIFKKLIDNSKYEETCIDNIIFISILANKLPVNQQKKARRIGLILAGVMRLGLLLLISQIMKLDQDLFTVFETGISGKDLILILLLYY